MTSEGGGGRRPVSSAACRRIEFHSQLEFVTFRLCERRPALPQAGPFYRPPPRWKMEDEGRFARGSEQMTDSENEAVYTTASTEVWTEDGARGEDVPPGSEPRAELEARRITRDRHPPSLGAGCLLSVFSGVTCALHHFGISNYQIGRFYTSFPVGVHEKKKIDEPRYNDGGGERMTSPVASGHLNKEESEDERRKDSEKAGNCGKSSPG
ncbi:hypothetical protein EYF80_036906 [Liparis tanakae]|uniref:Uncharacterized protein n=1 Tax=Liparis tanakae TaxID=230148 RepID=A0A4Z2GJ50_9TELE|nr:hypothetical protein EYF80_036906 [Liparis tanakae]